MNVTTQHDTAVRIIRCGVVLRVQEDECEVIRDGQCQTVRFASMFPSPRTERVQPGNLVATTVASDGTQTVLWRWYDAVVIDDGPNEIRLWEPAHGEVLARPRPAYVPGNHGTRAYLSAGLLGADWWVAGAARADAQNVDVELARIFRGGGRVAAVSA